ncbi:MAG: hypothetical protein Fur0012_05380 [Elusimicrobiota bacterium]
MDFEARKDFSIKAITLAFNLSSLIPLALYLYSPEKPFTPLLVFFIMTATSALTWLFSPVSYQITETKLKILRPIKDIEIDLGEISEIKKTDRASLKGTVRLFGSGGLYGFFGLFYKKGLGKFYAYCTNSSDLVLIKAGKIFLISPSHTETFISFLKGKKELNS